MSGNTMTDKNCIESNENMIAKRGKKSTFRIKKGLKYLVRGAATLQIIMATVLGSKLAAINLLPAKYMAVYVVGMAVMAVLIFLAAGRKKMVLATIISILIMGGLAYAFAAVSRLDATLQKVSTENESGAIEMAVVALADSGAETLTDVEGQKIGYVAGDRGSFAVKDAIAGATAVPVVYEEHSDVLALADALLAGYDDAIILNSVYIGIISDQDSYKGFSVKIKVLYTTEVDVQEEAEETDIGTEVIPVTESDTGSNQEGARLSLDENTFIVYLSGIDTFGSINVKSRSDVNILLAVNMTTGHIQLISTPRDYYVVLPDKGADKLTHAGLYGVECSKSVLENLYGIKIDYFLRVNFSGFEDIIDLLGGIDVYSHYDFTVEPIRHYVVGYNHLSGIEALAFARERYSFVSGDIQRGENQMEVIKAIIAKAISVEMVSNYSDILDEISNCIQTDMPPDVIYDLVRYQLSSKITWQVDSFVVEGSGSHKVTYSMPNTTSYVMIPDEADLDEARRLIENVLMGE